MKENSAQCRNVQGQLVEHWSRGETYVPAPLQQHVSECVGCSRYAMGLRAVSELFPQRQLYSQMLKTRTLAKITSVASESVGARMWTLMILGGFVGLIAWVIVPFVLLSTLTERYHFSAVTALVLFSVLLSMELASGLLIVAQVSGMDMRVERS